MQIEPSAPEILSGPDQPTSPVQRPAVLSFRAVLPFFILAALLIALAMRA